MQQNTSNQLVHSVKALRPARWLSNLSGTPEFNILVFSFLLNLAWEYWQVPFFRGMAEQTHWLGVKACTRATLGDAGITLAVFWVTAIFAKNRNWILQPRKADVIVFLGVGLLVMIFFEALATGVLARWSYNEAMPRLPVLGTGLLPATQWLIIPTIVMWFVRRQIGAPRRAIAASDAGRFIFLVHMLDGVEQQDCSRCLGGQATVP